jgi:succinate dehydrogenase/fumarate reductase flavoprotein subunit
LRAGLAHFLRANAELEEVGALTPHDLMRVMEGHFIRDCAEMAARASMYRTESRWGLYHYRQDYPAMDDERWFVHVNLKKDEAGEMAMLERPVAPYVVPLDHTELRGYHHLRIARAPSGASLERGISA